MLALIRSGETARSDAERERDAALATIPAAAQCADAMSSSSAAAVSNVRARVSWPSMSIFDFPGGHAGTAAPSSRSISSAFVPDVDRPAAFGFRSEFVGGHGGKDRRRAG